MFIRKNPLLWIMLTALVFISSPAFAQWHPDSIPEYFKRRYLSEEEMNTPLRNVNFVETPPPPGTARMVAEFEPMQAVLIRYPLGIPYSLIREMAEDTEVITLVSSNSQANTVLNLYQNNNVNTANCSFLVAPTDSYWTRDYGPWFIFDGNNEPGIVDFPYNRPRPNDNNVPPKVAELLGINLFGMNVIHTGGNMMADGHQIGSSTDLVYEENTQSAAQIAQKYVDYLGIQRYDVLPDPLGDYIKHIDCWGKYLAPDKILLGQVLPSDPRYSDFEAVANFFASTPSAYGYPYKVYRVYTPGGNPATPYTNSLILNNKVFVPITGSQHDNAALAVYQEAMPGYEIIGIQHNGWMNTDALHCRTHEIADLGMLYVRHLPLYGQVEWQDSLAVSATITAYSGSALIQDSLKVYYSINGGPYVSKALTTSLGNSLSGYISGYEAYDTIRYYITAADESGRSMRHPYMGAIDPHLFVLDRMPLADITITPDTMYFTDGYEGQFVIKNHTAGEVEIAGIQSEDWMVNLPELPDFPFALGLFDSLVVQVEIIPGVNQQPSFTFVEAGIGIQSAISNRQVTLMIEEQLISNTSNLNAELKLNVLPNPFNENVVFSIQNSFAPLSVEILDMNGRVIRQWNNLMTDQKIMRLEWDGRDANGSLLPKGMYYYRVHNKQSSYAGKLIRN